MCTIFAAGGCKSGALRQGLGVGALRQGLGDAPQVHVRLSALREDGETREKKAGVAHGGLAGQGSGVHEGMRVPAHL